MQTESPGVGSLVRYFIHIIVEPLWSYPSPSHRHSMFLSWAETCVGVGNIWNLDLSCCGWWSWESTWSLWSWDSLCLIWEWHPHDQGWFEIKIFGIKHFVIRKESLVSSSLVLAFYRWEECSSERMSGLPRVPQAGTGTEASWPVKRPFHYSCSKPWAVAHGLWERMLHNQRHCCHWSIHQIVGLRRWSVAYT